MATSPERLLRQIRQLACPPAQDPAADGVLLQRFVRSRDDSAFAALVGRHGPMVLAVCRGILGDAHQAEDAFQATWLVLARKAATVRPPSRLAAWLHGVARHLALKCRRADTRRRHLEARAIPPESPRDPLDELTARELLLAFDEELQRLPEVFRLPLILCCLEGRSQEEAARLLGWRPGSVKGRLERGRARLHARLARRGLTLAAALAAGEMVRGLAFASAPVPTAATVQTVLAFAGGTEAAGAGVSAKVAALAEEGAKAMARAKMKLAVVLLLGASVAVAGTGMLAHEVLAAKQLVAEQQAPQQPPVGDARRTQPEDEKPVRTDRYGDPLPDGALARLGTLRLRHAGGRALVFSADGKRLTSFGTDQAVRTWDVVSGALLRKVPAPSEDFPVETVAFSPDVSTLVTCRRAHRELCLWDGSSGRELGTITCNWNLPGGPGLALAPDGRTLAVADYGTVHLLDPVTGSERMAPLPHRTNGAVLQVVFSPDGKVLASTSSSGGPTWLWDTTTGKALHRLTTQDEIAAFSPDGKILASAGHGERVTLWDLATGKEQGTLPLPPPTPVMHHLICLAFSPDGKILAAGGDERPVVLLDVATRKELHRLPTVRAEVLLFAPDGKTLVTSANGAFRLWDVATGEELHTREGHRGEVNAVALSPDGRLVASGSWYDRTVRLWDAATGRQLHVLTGHEGYIRAVDFAPDGRALVSGGRDGTLRLWDAATGKPLRVFSMNGPKEEDAQEVIALRLSANGKTLAALGATSHDFRSDFSLWAWDVATGQELVKRPVPVGDFTACFSADAKTVARAANDWVVLEDVASRKRREVCTGNRPDAPLVFSPDGRRLAVGHRDAPEDSPGRSLAVYDLSEDGDPLTLDTGPVGLAAFSADGRYLATAGPEDLRLWELASGREVLRRPRPEPFHSIFRNAFASSLAFAPDGRHLVTGLPDSTVLLWDLAPPHDPKPRVLDHLWADLAGDDGPQSYAAIWALSRGPAAKVVSFIRERLPVARGPDAERLRRLLRELDSDDFEVRRTALRTLEGMRDEARPALRQALTGGLSAEVRKHLEGLVAGSERLLHAGDVLRGVRAVEVLERVGTAEAQQVLQELAKGAPEARLTQEAKTSLERLARRAVPAP
jgi:RNA polymerase sigma factor (sigma-70 family)